jgi:hypothetical protein
LKNNIKHLRKLKELASRFKLLVFKKDVLGNMLIGLDLIKKRLVFLNQNNKKTNCTVVSLKNIKSCTLKKEYDSIESGGLKNKKLHEYLQSVFLELRFENNAKVMVLSFFEKQKDKLLNISELEAKAKEWQETISNLILKRIPETA